MTHRQTRVAIVDDDASVRRALTRLLSWAGYDVEVYETADAFLASATLATLDCALVDVRMPGDTGLELVSALRAAHITLPVILMTGDAAAGLEEKARCRGVFALLSKPLPYGTITETIDAAVVGATAAAWRTGPGRR